MLSVHCLSVLSCLSVCDVHALWPNGLRIKLKLGTQVGLGPDHIALDGNHAFPPQRGTALTQFSVHICCGQMAAWIKMPFGIELGLIPCDFVLDGDPALPSPERGQSPLPNFWPVSIVAKRLHASRCHLVWR